jgi:hypothetical protein
MPQQQHVDDHHALHSSELQPNDYAHMHGSFENFGVFNGQFDLGPPGEDETVAPEGWAFDEYTDGEGRRVTGGLFGHWCLRGGQAGTGAGVIVASHKMMPVAEEEENYVLRGWFKSSSGTGRISFGLACYDTNKTLIGLITPYNNRVEPAAWERLEATFGPEGDYTFPAGTRYVRVYIDLQNDSSLTGEYAYVDDVKFRQRTFTPAESPEEWFQVTDIGTKALGDNAFTDIFQVTISGAAFSPNRGMLSGHLWVSVNGRSRGSPDMVARLYYLTVMSFGGLNLCAQLQQVGADNANCFGVGWTPNLTVQVRVSTPTSLIIEAKATFNACTEAEIITHFIGHASATVTTHRMYAEVL